MMVTSGLLVAGSVWTIVEDALDRFRLNCSAMDGARHPDSAVELHLFTVWWKAREDF
jgi:hypothetical protein